MRGVRQVSYVFQRVAVNFALIVFDEFCIHKQSLSELAAKVKVKTRHMLKFQTANLAVAFTNDSYKWSKESFHFKITLKRFGCPNIIRAILRGQSFKCFIHA